MKKIIALVALSLSLAACGGTDPCDPSPCFPAQGCFICNPATLKAADNRDNKFDLHPVDADTVVACSVNRPNGCQ